MVIDAVVSRVALVRINAEDLSQETIGTYSFKPNEPLLAPFDMPNSLAFGPCSIFSNLNTFLHERAIDACQG